MIRVSAHAVERYRERVCPCSKAEARRRILVHTVALEKAVAFGACCVRTGGGVGLVLSGNTVSTVFGAGMRLGPVG